VTASVEVWTVDAAGMAEVRPRLCEILINSVENGASVGFLAPLDLADADAYWRRIELAVGDRRCVLLVAELVDAGIVGTVQLGIDTLPNQPHRATVSKLLVHSTARRRGVGEALMVALERVAVDAGRWLLTLDTATADAERLYERTGWTRAGLIPNYALNPDGTLTATAWYWKELPRRPGRSEKAAGGAAPLRVRVDENRGEQDEPRDHELRAGRQPEQVEAVLDRGDDEGPE
jgi:ribosomal protein S18 acetylase RimI-like enzyme